MQPATSPQWERFDTWVTVTEKLIRSYIHYCLYYIILTPLSTVMCAFVKLDNRLVSVKTSRFLMTMEQFMKSDC